MKCFLRLNSPEIREKLTQNGIFVCLCCEFEDAEWLCCQDSKIVHGIYPDDEYSEELLGNKEVFKDTFLLTHKDYIDCREDISLFIKTIELTEASMSQNE